MRAYKNGNKPKQMQSHKSFRDFILGFMISPKLPQRSCLEENVPNVFSRVPSLGGIREEPLILRAGEGVLRRSLTLCLRPTDYPAPSSIEAANMIEYFKPTIRLVSPPPI